MDECMQADDQLDLTSDLCNAQPLTIDGPVGPLEAELSCPDNSAGPIAVLCHPHPLYGGSMTNKVVHYLSRTLLELGVATLRFNFRGVGRSAGSFDQGVGESEDALAVVHWAQKRAPERVLWLGGFSFGAYVALRLAARHEFGQLITIAPPVNLFDHENLSAVRSPWLLVQGGADEIVHSEQVLAWSERQQPRPDLLYFDDVDHFFHGKLNLLREGLLQRLGPVAPASSDPT